MANIDRYFYSSDTRRFNVFNPPMGPFQHKPYLRSKQYSRRKFQVKVDVKSFKSEEVSVRVKDNYIIVEGKHEERDEDGLVVVHFTHSYIMPEEYDPRTIKSYYSSLGIVTITAKRFQPTVNVEEQPIEVSSTNSKSENLSEITEESVNEVIEEENEDSDGVPKEE
ncbi:unnamed protein product [Diamesa hyperborea]